MSADSHTGVPAFLVGTLNPFIDFCREAAAIFELADCGSGGESITIKSSIDPSLDPLPEQNDQLFFPITMTD